MPLNKKRTIRPDDLDLILQMPGIAAVARDEELRAFWCTPLSMRIPGIVGTTASMLGKLMSDIVPEIAAQERVIVCQRVMASGQSEQYYQFSADMRVLCTVFPLDEAAFGHRGVFGVVMDAPVNSRLSLEQEIPVVCTPILGELSVLSLREFEILHSVALGMSRAEIAKKLCRALKTVENHINSIHHKLGTHSRAQLVRYASERGIQAFSDEEWLSIVDGAKRMRRSSS